MKFKKGKKVWAILSIVFILLYIVGIVGAFITKKDIDAFNLIILFLLISNLSNFVESED